MDHAEKTFQGALQAPEYTNHTSDLAFIVGTDANGDLLVADLRELSHLVIAGATGTGKSTLAHQIILSIAQRSSPERVRLMLCDTKMLEFAKYAGLPHLLLPLTTDGARICSTIKWVASEVGRRLAELSRTGHRSIDSYNLAAPSQQLPYLVIVVDDISTLALDGDTSDAVSRIVPNGRPAGVHLIMVTQSPSSKPLSGLIKTAIPGRAVFSVMTQSDERLLLGAALKKPISEAGTMVFYNVPTHLKRVVDSYHVSDGDISATVQHAAKQYTAPPYSEDALKSIERDLMPPDYDYPDYESSDPEPWTEELDGDEMLPFAVDVILETGQASVSMLQRRLKLGYARASRIVDEMEGKGIVGPFQGSKPRAILITPAQWAEMREDILSGGADLSAGNHETVDTPLAPPPPVIPEPMVIKLSHNRRRRHLLTDLFRRNSRDTGDDPIIITTNEALREFTAKHPLVADFYTKVVGVTFDNTNGTNRQDILSRCSAGEAVLFKPFRYQGSPALAVYSEHGQIGNLSAELAENLENDYGCGLILSGTISEVTGGTCGMKYGCNLHIKAYQD